MNVLLLDKTKKLELVKGEVKHADVVTVKGKGYKIIADAVTYLVKERLFGFLPPKIQPTFFGLDSDSALLILDNETLRIDKSFEGMPYCLYFLLPIILNRKNLHEELKSSQVFHSDKHIYLCLLQ